MSCTHCNDTGSLSKDLYGFLDCAHCHAAGDRDRLHSWMLEQPQRGDIGHVDNAAAWLIYQHGKSAAAARGAA